MNSYLQYHYKKYKNWETLDKVKMVYQATLGPNHFNSSIEEMEDNYNKELKEIKEVYDTNLYEHIGNFYIRVNLNVYSKFYEARPLLLKMLENKVDFNEHLLELQKNLCLTNDFYFLNLYDYKPVNHSITYKKLYHPHYRVVKYDFLNIDMRTKQLQNYIDSFKDFTIFALEGKCASGKTTIANNLKDVTIIDVDDFFLKADLKTKDRLAEVGGNIDYNLYLECISKIKEGATITYKVFDCKSQSYYEKSVTIKKHVLLVGVYSYHEKVRGFIDKLCVLLVDKNTQMDRINKRELKDKFIKEWIPMEEKYYNSFDFIKNADILI